MVAYLAKIVENEPIECDRLILQHAQWGRPTHYYLYVGAHAALRQMGAPDALGAPSRRMYWMDTQRAPSRRTGGAQTRRL